MEPVKPPRQIIINQSHWRAMREHVDALAPEEGCGILAGLDGRCLSVITLSNALRSKTRYAVAAEELLETIRTLERNRWELLAIFHSHPNGEARPSATDIDEACYLRSAYLILAPEGDTWICRAFLIQDRTASEIPLRIL